MRTLSFCLLLASLTGCTTSGSMYGPGVASESYPTRVRVSATAVDTDAINAAIAADNRYYWAPQEEVLQQAMSNEI